MKRYGTLINVASGDFFRVCFVCDSIVCLDVSFRYLFCDVEWVKTFKNLFPKVWDIFWYTKWSKLTIILQSVFYWFIAYITLLCFIVACWCLCGAASVRDIGVYGAVWFTFTGIGIYRKSSFLRFSTIYYEWNITTLGNLIVCTVPYAFYLLIWCTSILSTDNFIEYISKSNTGLFNATNASIHFWNNLHNQVSVKCYASYMLICICRIYFMLVFICT